MLAYSLTFRASVEKDLRRLPTSLVDRLLQRIEALVDEPLPRQSVKLSGSDRLYRLRVGDYRVIYEVDDEQRRITVQLIRHRRDVYRR
jgi:mRNA interferase RelE/StbE